MLLPFIHRLPFIKLFIFHPHPSFYFTVLHHCPRWVCVEKFHLSASPSRVTEPIGPGGQTSNVGCWPWLSKCLRTNWSWLVAGQRERPTSNDKWLSQNKHASEEGRAGGGKALNHSFIIHQSLLVLSLTSGLCTFLSSSAALHFRSTVFCDLCVTNLLEQNLLDYFLV